MLGAWLSSGPASGRAGEPTARPTGSPEDVLRERLAAASKEAVWRTPTLRERDRLRDLMSQVLAVAQGDPPTPIGGGATRACESDPVRLLALRSAAEALGFVADVVPVAEEHWLVLHDAPAHRRGGGFYVFRCGPALPLVVQAPHAFFDRHTRELAIAAFAQGRARAAFFNTVHRFRGAPGERPHDPVHPADVAHQPGSFFHAATVGAAMADDRLRFVQLHGFEARTGDGAFILSSGRREDPPRALALALAGDWAEVQLYGETTRRLGATQNVQQRALQEQGARRFVHLEMAGPTREALRADAARRAAWIRALQGPWW